jgi:hypothetical protein
MSNFHPAPVEQREGGGGGGGIGGLGGSLRIGGANVPYWVIGLGVAGLAVAVWFFMKSRNSGTASATGVTGANTGSAQAGLTPMAAAGTSGSYDLMPVPYPTAGTTVGATPAQASGLGIQQAANVPDASGSPAGPGTGPITTPSGTGYDLTNQIYYVAAGEPGTAPSQNNPSAQSLTNPVAA